MNTKIYAVTDDNGCPISFFMIAGQVRYHIGTAVLLDELPKAHWLTEIVMRTGSDPRVPTLKDGMFRLSSIVCYGYRSRSFA